MYGYLLCIFSVLFVIYLKRTYWLFIFNLNGWRGIIVQPFIWLLLFLHLEPNSLMSSIKRFREYLPSPFALFLWNRIVLYVDDPEVMESILLAPECLNKTFLHNGFFARHGLLHAKDDKWKMRRKQLNPAFTFNTILNYWDDFNTVANKMQRQLRQILNTTNEIIMQHHNTVISFDELDDFISRAVLEVSCLTLMGTETNFVDKDVQSITKTYKYLMNISALKTMKPWLQINRIFYWLDHRNYEETVKSNKIVEDFVAEIVRQKRCDIRNPKNLTASSLMNGGNVKRNDRNFTEQILHLEKLGELTSNEVINETQSMVMVSFETVSTSLIIVLLCLAANYECQRQLRQEITDTIIGSEPIAQTDNIQIQFDDLQKMPYLDMVINESLRLLTTIPMNLRNVGSDLKMRMNARIITIPKNSIIVLDAFNMQRSKKVWGPRALEFHPEHFSKTQTTTQRHSFAFIPFSKGLRTCIGSRYSVYVLKIFLINLIMNFDFRTNVHLEDLRFIEGISLKFLNADKIQFQIRCLEK